MKSSLWLMARTESYPRVIDSSSEAVFTLLLATSRLARMDRGAQAQI